MVAETILFPLIIDTPGQTSLQTTGSITTTSTLNVQGLVSLNNLSIAGSITYQNAPTFSTLQLATNALSGSFASGVLSLAAQTYTDTVTAANGSAAPFAAFRVGGTTLASSNTFVTVPNASSVYISGPPTAGTNVTLTSASSLYVASGTTYFGGDVTVVGTTLHAPAVAGGQCSSIYADTLPAVSSFWRVGKALTGLSSGSFGIAQSELGAIFVISDSGLVNVQNTSTSTIIAQNSFYTLGGAGITKNLQVGGSATITGSASASTLNVTGSFTAGSSSVSPHLLQANVNGNVLVVQNTNTSGFSALALKNAAGAEMGVLGYGNSGVGTYLTNATYLASNVKLILNAPSCTIYNTTESTSLVSAALINNGGFANTKSILVGMALTIALSACSGPATSSQGAFLTISPQTYTDTTSTSAATTATFMGSYVGQPTLASSSTNVTTTLAATVYIAGAPVAGTNQSITNAFALYIVAGTSRFGGNIVQTTGTASFSALGATTAVFSGLVTAQNGLSVTTGTTALGNVTVSGLLAATATSGSHTFKTSSTGTVLSVQNLSVSGYAAIGYVNSAGSEMGTIGYGNTSVGGVLAGNIYVNSAVPFTINTGPTTVYNTSEALSLTNASFSIRGGLAVTKSLLIGTTLTAGFTSYSGAPTNGAFISVNAATFTDSGTAANGTAASFSGSYVAAPTLAAAAANVTTTSASTLTIAGPPVAGTNQTITSSYAMNVQSGTSYFGGPLVNVGPHNIQNGQLRITNTSLGAETSLFFQGNALNAGWFIGQGIGGNTNILTFFNNFANVTTFAMTTGGDLSIRGGLTCQFGGVTTASGTFSGLITGTAGLTISAGTTSLQAVSATTGTFSGLITGTAGLTISAGTTSLQAVGATTGAFSGLITGANGLTISAGASVLQSVSTALITAVATSGLHTFKTSGTGNAVIVQNTSASGSSSVNYLNSAGADVGAIGYGNASVGGVLASTLYVNTASPFTINTGLTTVYNTTDATSLTNAAFSVKGGAAITRSLLVGTNITAGSAGSTAASTGATASAFFTVSASTFTDSSTAASGTATAFNGSVFGAPTLAATASGVTTTTASTLTISGSPVAGTNQSITTSYALNVQSGTSQFSGNIQVNGSQTITNGQVRLVSSTLGAETSIFYQGNVANTGWSVGQNVGGIGANNFGFYNTQVQNAVIFSNAGDITARSTITANGTLVANAGLTVVGNASLQSLAATTGTFTGLLTGNAGLTVTSGATSLQAITATSATFTSLTTNGNVTGNTTSGIHTLRTNSTGNVLNLQNQNASGYTAVSYLNSAGAEIAVIGYANASAGGGLSNSLYINTGVPLAINTGIATFSNGTDATTLTNAGVSVRGGLAVSKSFLCGYEMIIGLTAYAGPSTGTTSGALLSVLSTTYTDNSTAASATSPGFVSTFFGVPTLAATSTGVTTTVASTVLIAGPPVAGTNQTITTSYALNVQTGASIFGGPVAVQALTATSGTFSALVSANNGLTVSAGTTSVQAITGTNATFSGILNVGSAASNTHTIVTNFAGGNAINVQNASITGYTSISFRSSTGAEVGVFGYGNANVSNTALRNIFYIIGAPLSIQTATSVTSTLTVGGTTLLSSRLTVNVNSGGAIYVTNPTLGSETSVFFQGSVSNIGWVIGQNVGNVGADNFAIYNSQNANVVTISNAGDVVARNSITSNGTLSAAGAATLAGLSATSINVQNSIFATATGPTGFTLLGTNPTDGAQNTRIVVSGATRGQNAGWIEYITTGTGVHRFWSAAVALFTIAPLLTTNNYGFATAVSAFSGTPALANGTFVHVAPQTFTDTATAASSTTAAFTGTYIGIPTLAATATGVTTTLASTLYIAGSPVAGTNESIGTSYALNVASGTSIFGGQLIAAAGFTSTVGTTTLGTTTLGTTTMSTATINGILTVSATSGIHLIRTNSGGNTLAVQNQNASGYSAIAYLNSAGSEMAAIGYGNGSVGGILNNSLYINSGAPLAVNTGLATVYNGTDATTLLNAAFSVRGGVAITKSLLCGQAITAGLASFAGPATGLTSGAFFGISAATYTDNTTAASGTATGFVSTYLAVPTIAASASGVTTQSASTLYIAGAPVAGTNNTLGSAFALNVASGTTFLGGNVTQSGGRYFLTGSNAQLAIMNTAVGSETSINFSTTASSGSGWVIGQNVGGAGTNNFALYNYALAGNAITISSTGLTSILNTSTSNATPSACALYSAGGVGAAKDVVVGNSLWVNSAIIVNATSSGQTHVLQSNFNGGNIVAVQNNNNAGYSAVSFRNTGGAEQGFIGYSNPGAGNYTDRFYVGSVTKTVLVNSPTPLVTTIPMHLVLYGTTTYYNSGGTAVTPNNNAGNQYYYITLGTTGATNLNWTPTYTSNYRLVIPYNGLYMLKFGATGSPNVNEYFISRNAGNGNDLNANGDSLLGLASVPSTGGDFTITCSVYLTTTDFVAFGMYTNNANNNAVGRTIFTATLIQRTG